MARSGGARRHRDRRDGLRQQQVELVEREHAVRSSSTGCEQRRDHDSRPPRPAAGGAGSAAVTNYLTYVDGKAGKANPSLPPVTIGFVNQQGGQQRDRRARHERRPAGGQVRQRPSSAASTAIRSSSKTCFITSAEEEGTTCGAAVPRQQGHFGDRRGRGRDRRPVALLDARHREAGDRRRVA